MSFTREIFFAIRDNDLNKIKNAMDDLVSRKVATMDQLINDRHSFPGSGPNSCTFLA